MSDISRKTGYKIYQGYKESRFVVWCELRDRLAGVRRDRRERAWRARA